MSDPTVRNEMTRTAADATAQFSGRTTEMSIWKQRKQSVIMVFPCAGKGLIAAGTAVAGMRGAEAVIEIENGKVRKNRVKKSYRIAELDLRLRRERTKCETRLIDKARRAGVPVPRIFQVSEHEIEMEEIKGETLRDIIGIRFAEQVGRSLARLHEGDIIHGDLTTSNMVVRDGVVHFIDFGLGSSSKRVEDKAVDLHLLERALNAKHPAIAKRFFKKVLLHYKPSNKREILQRLSKIEARGRYK